MLQRLIIIYLLLLAGLTSSAQAQSLESDVEAAAALYRANEPVEAARRLREILTSAGAPQMTPQVRSKAYTYLAMSEWALYRRAETTAAMESALRTDTRTFVAHGRSWAREHRTITDSVTVTLLSGAVALYEEAEYAACVEEISLILPLEDLPERSFAVEMHKYLAFCYVAMRKTTLAQQEFRTALRLDPNLELGDGAVVAPKLQRAFVSVQRDAVRQSHQNTRRNTMLRSLALPGWGQHYRGSRLRGYAYMAAEMSLLTGTALSLKSYSQARNAYEKFGVTDALAVYHEDNSIEAVRLELDARYGRYRSKSRQANVMITLAVGVWAVNVVDALILSLRPDGRRMADRSSGPAMGWNPGLKQWSLNYRIRW